MLLFSVTQKKRQLTASVKEEEVADERKRNREKLQIFWGGPNRSVCIFFFLSTLRMRIEGSVQSVNVNAFDITSSGTI